MEITPMEKTWHQIQGLSKCYLGITYYLSTPKTVATGHEKRVSANGPLKKSFQNSPSGNRGTSKGFKQSFANRNSSIKRGARKSRASFLTSKNVQAGGHSKAFRVSNQTTRRGGSTPRGSKPRGGKSNKGRGRGKFKRS